MTNARRAGIYAITNTKSGDRYYGSARLLGRRWLEHRRLLRHGKHANAPLQHAWNKYGEGVFLFEVLAVLEPEEVRSTEQRLLDRFYGCEHCYNVSRDSLSPMTGRKQTPEHTAKVAAANRGKKRDPAAIEKTAAFHRGRKRSAEIRAMIGAASRGRKRSAESIAKSAASRLGRPLRAEVRKKISLAKKGKKLSDEHRAALSTARIGMKRSAESIEKTAAAHRGKPRTEAERSAISAGMTEAGRKKLSEQKRAYWAAKRAANERVA